jgi:protein-tyrosine phosphatase
MDVEFADIHCHLLPGLDDGPADWGESLAMARMAAADGIRRIAATPHQLGNFPENGGDLVRTHSTELQRLIDIEGIPLHVWPGADVRVEPELVAKIAAGDVLTLADMGRHLLLELPHEMYLPLDRLLAELKAAGLVGILSHPERNRGIRACPQVLTRLVDAGCLMQVTAGSVLGSFGAEIQGFAQRLLCDGLVHFLATDAHGCHTRRPLMRRAFEHAETLVGEELAYEMCCRNPRRVLAGREVLPGRRDVRRRRVARWFPWRRAA